MDERKLREIESKYRRLLRFRAQMQSIQRPTRAASGTGQVIRRRKGRKEKRLSVTGERPVSPDSKPEVMEHPEVGEASGSKRGTYSSRL